MIPAEALFAASEATWPSFGHRRAGAFTVREGRGGGSRVSSASAGSDWSASDIDLAEGAMAAMDQPLLFMIRPGQAALDEALQGRGYHTVNTTLIYAAPIAELVPPPDPMTAFPHWPPLAVTEAIWTDEGIGPPRRAVMDRVAGPHAAILGRTADHPVGAAFVAVASQIAALHALAVRKEVRRTGTGGNILRCAAAWAADQGATTLMLAVTEANAPARALYASLGMQAVEQYHYRVK